MSYELNVILQLFLLAPLWRLFVFIIAAFDWMSCVNSYSIRDNLFREVDCRGLFGADAYGITRATLNGMIRFAHEMSLSRIFLVIILRRWSKSHEAANDYMQHLKEALDGVKIEDQKVIVAAHADAHLALMLHVMRTSRYFFTSADDELLMFAGLWDTWRQPDDETLVSFTIITVAPNDFVARFRGRMPVALEAKDCYEWLNADDPRPLLKACHNEALITYLVTMRMDAAAIKVDGRWIQNEDSPFVEPIALET